MISDSNVLLGLLALGFICLAVLVAVGVEQYLAGRVKAPTRQRRAHMFPALRSISIPWGKR